ncbi:MAG: LysE family transporter [Desulfobacterales bacterium]|uniref:LysE family translocator n=1 Tax=Desulfosarcina sp. TaxID=2027861 RepID=UPI0029B47795|nr:LysE family transporter [Desulfosarcina sp.]MDX2447053.1 LysE family transporter [Desulfobacterales bacterium]MDX2491503.1 LysE family transporter [Desulfosarcina sp.]
MTEFFTIGIVLGLSAGFAPGPLLALVISETLQHDIRSGIKVALSPIFTDLPIIIVTLAVLSKLSDFQHILGIISLIGGCVILFMGYESMNPESPESEFSDTKPNSLAKGILANALSPHPYLFWFSVGGPIMSRAINLNVKASIAFIGSFYVLLVGSKMLLAVLVGRSKSFLNGTWYIYTMRLLGLALCILALLLFRDGLKLLGIINF